MNFDSIFLNDEKCAYQMKIFKDTKRIDEIGKMTTVLKKIKNEIEITNELEIFSQGMKEITTVKVGRTNFLPRVYKSYITLPTKNITIIGEYKKSTVEAKMISDQKEKKFKIKLPNNYYDNTTAFYLFRVFAFGLLSQNRFHIVNLNAGQKVLVELKISGEEEVRCDIGEFNCLGIKMKLCEYPQLPIQKFLYDKNAPHCLIKNIAGSKIIELKEIGGINGDF